MPDCLRNWRRRLYGESLVPLPNLPAGRPELHHHQPPLTNGFFAGEPLHAIAYEAS
jgi:hypothetical protein